MISQPAIEVARLGGDQPSALVIIAHGGRADSVAPAGGFTMTYAWQRWVTPWVIAAARGSSVDQPRSARSSLALRTPRSEERYRAGRTRVWRLRYRVRGWNGAAADAAQDLRWAVRMAAAELPGVPVILVGHSMGGRAAIYAAGEPNVAAVCLLAPWIEDGDPVGDLIGKPVLIVHGSADRTTDPRRSRTLATEVGAQFATVDGVGHTMVGGRARWRALIIEFLAKQVATLGA
jgi:pimeloyl-ACP methyl ester carboxylesterase